MKKATQNQAKQKPQVQSSRKGKIDIKASIPVATGHTVMSSATQFRTKMVRDAKKYPGSVCITGHEYLAGVSTTSATTGLNLLTVYLNPTQFASTRLKKYGELYDKFLFRKFVLHYTSADPSTATGQYILAYDRDYADTTPSADAEGIRKYFAMKASAISNVYLSTQFRCPLEDCQDFYYTNDTGYEGRLVYQGQLYLAAVSGTTFHGSMWIEYECEFYDPQLEDDPAVYEQETTAIEIQEHTALDHHFHYLEWLTPDSILGGDGKGPGFQVKANGLSGQGLETGQNGILIPPGDYLFAMRLAIKTDSSGEGITSDNEILFFPYNRATQAQGSPNGTIDTPPADVDVIIIEESGFNIADSNSSATFRFFLSIPPTAGLMWLFLNGFLTDTAVVTYADAIIQIVATRVYASLPNTIRKGKKAERTDKGAFRLRPLDISWPFLGGTKPSTRKAEQSSVEIKEISITPELQPKKSSRSLRQTNVII